MNAKLKLTWVRQTPQFHIYEVRFPNVKRADTIAIPKSNPNPNYCLPTTHPPKELVMEIKLLEVEVQS